MIFRNIIPILSCYFLFKKISSGYKYCNGNSGVTCNCGLFITKDIQDKPKSAYINFCSEDILSDTNLGYDGNYYSLEKCSNTPKAKSYEQVFDENFWSDRDSFENDFINCAQISESRFFVI